MAQNMLAKEEQTNTEVKYRKQVILNVTDGNN
jgi:hypothetical protein